MAPPKKPLRDRTHVEGYCLIWDGAMKRGKPFVKGVGNPARELLGIKSARIQVRLDCPHANPRCIEPLHQRVLLTQDNKFGDLPAIDWRDPRITNSGFTQAEVEEIEAEVQALREDPDLVEFVSHPDPRIYEEIMSRFNSSR